MGSALLSQRLITIFSLVLIAVVGLLAYANSFYVPFSFDDEGHIRENQFIRDPANFSAALKGGKIPVEHDYQYSPRRFIGYVSFALNYHFGGLDVTGYHIVNLSIHVVNAILVYCLVILIFSTQYFNISGTSDRRPENQDMQISNHQSPVPALIALFAALIFVAHPVQTQAVTYIVQRFTSLAAMFYLLSAVTYLMAKLARRQANRLASYLASLVSAILAMKTKEISFTLPFIIILTEFLFFHSAPKKKFFFLLPVLLTVIIIPLSVIGTEIPLGELLSDLSEKTRVQTGLSRWDYFMTEFRVIVTYIRLLFFPVNQNLDYDYPTEYTFFSLPVVLSFLLLASLLGSALYLVYKSGHADKLAEERGLHQSPFTIHYERLIAFGILWFFITVSVESSFIPIVDVIFEHRVYLPSVGAFIAMTSAAFILDEKFFPPTRAKAGLRGLRITLPVSPRSVVVPGLLMLLVLALSVATFSRNKVWQDEYTLWEDALKKSPGKPRVLYNFGNKNREIGKNAEAIQLYKKTLQIDPLYVDAQLNLGAAHENMGDFEEAVYAYARAIEIDPTYVKPYNNLGAVFIRLGKYADAIEMLKKAVSLDSYYHKAYNNLGSAYAEMGLYRDALLMFTRAIELDKNYAVARFNLGYVSLRVGDREAALLQYDLLRKTRPEWAARLSEVIRQYYQ